MKYSTYSYYLLCKIKSRGLRNTSETHICHLFCWTQVKAIAQLLVRFNWTWVGLVRGDHEYGRFAVQGLLRELEGTKVCVAYQEMIPLLYNQQRALEIMQVDTKTHYLMFYDIKEFSLYLKILIYHVLITHHCFF